MLKLFSLSFSMYTLVFDIHDTDMSRECPLLRKRYCTFKKDKTGYCHQNRLMFVEHNNEICAMGQAAQLLSLYRRPLQKIT